MRMKKLTPVVLFIVLVLTMSGTTFAAVTSDDDQFPEAGQIYVEEEGVEEGGSVGTNEMPNGARPASGARPARKEDKEAAKLTIKKQTVFDSSVYQKASWLSLLNYKILFKIRRKMITGRIRLCKQFSIY